MCAGLVLLTRLACQQSVIASASSRLGMPRLATIRSKECANADPVSLGLCLLGCSEEEGTPVRSSQIGLLLCTVCPLPHSWQDNTCAAVYIAMISVARSVVSVLIGTQ